MGEAASLRLAPIGTTGRPGVAPADESSLLAEIGAAAEAGADLVLLPQLSFSLYFPASRNREALELGERFPSKPMGAAREAAAGSWLAASAYECVGEGVFYVSAELGSETEGLALTQRQHQVDARPGRYEQMFFSPGHEERVAAEMPWGRTAMLIGSDVRDPEAWDELARLGTQLVLVSVSEAADGWQGVCRIAAGFAAAYGIAVASVNRAGMPDEPDFAGGAFACDATGGEIAADAEGLINLSIPTSRRVEL